MMRGKICLMFTMCQALNKLLYMNYIVCFFFSFLHFRVVPTAYGGSQARGLIEATAAAYTTATAIPHPSRVCNLHHSSRQRQILNPLSEARDRTCNLMVPSQIHFRRTTTGTPKKIFFYSLCYCHN